MGFMLSGEQLKQILNEQWNLALRMEPGVERDILGEINEKLKIPHVLVISGLRRSGKSTLLRQAMRKFYADRDFYYVSFEDERLMNFDAAQFNDIYEALVELFGEKKTFFLDEIQNIPRFETFVRRFYDAGFKFIITGSNAKLLSRELGTKLTGRHLDLVVRPFSFKEFLSLRGFKFDKNALYSTEGKAATKRLFGEYLMKGGMPEYLRYGDPAILARVYEDIVIKDIAVRYGVKNVAQLRELYKYLITNSSARFSLNTLKNILHFGSVNTVKKYVSCLEETYFATAISKFDYSLKKQMVNNKKLYVVDNGFLPLLSTKTTKDRGRMLENLVFNRLNEQYAVFYYSNKKECDFVLVKDNKVVSAVQVCWELDETDKPREIGGLAECMTALGLRNGLLLTYDQEDELSVGGKTVLVKPVWKWLLE